jgi:ABC-2 type transport system permease protein
MSELVTLPEAERTANEPVECQPVTFGRLVHSEWIKFRSLRSTWWVLATAAVTMLALALIIAYNTRHLTANQQAEDLVPSAPLQGSDLAQLLLGALGIVFVTGEFSTGMIRSTLTAVPRRLPVLAAKLAVFAAVTAALMAATSLIAFLAAQGLIGHYRTGYSLSSPGAFRTVMGTAIYLTLVGVIGMMIGWIVRSTPGALVTYAALVLVVPALFGNFLQHWGLTVDQYTPPQAGASFSSNLPDPPALSPWAGFWVVVAWASAATLTAIGTLRRRDA